MNSWRILVAEPENFSERALSLLADIATLDCRPIEQRKMKWALENYDVVWVRLHLTVGSCDLPYAPRCRFIVSATTGTDHLDLEGLKEIGIQVLCLKGEVEFLETIGVTAELTLGLILSLMRHLPASIESVKQGRWDRDAFRGRELYGQTAGIIGLGRLGKKVSRYLLAVGMKVIGWDPFVGEVDGVISAASLEDMLMASDVVTVHIPLDTTTVGMFDDIRFSKMRQGAFFINTSRGALVDERALLRALTSGHLGGAALDVLCGEPDISRDNPLLSYARSHANLLITPHIGGAVEGVMGRCEEYMAAILKRKLGMT